VCELGVSSGLLSLMSLLSCVSSGRFKRRFIFVLARDHFIWCIMKVLFMFILLAAFAVACDPDKDGHGCPTVTKTWHEASLSCPWKVTSDDITVNNPLIQQSNPGIDCPFLDKGLMHLQTCKKCGSAHVPCNNTFTACGGCCDSTQSDIVLREHSCADVKSYFRWRNECPLKLMNATLDDEPDTSAVLQPKIKDHSKAKVLATGILTDKCSVGVEKFECPKIPAMIQFDCNPCNIGSADLMTKCCNECVRFSTSETLEKMTMIEPFVVCGGCQTEIINIPWKGTVIQQPWKDAGKYDAYSRKSQEDRMDKWVDKNICANLSKDTCPKPQQSGDRRLREAVSTTTTTTREALAAQCRRLLASTTSVVASTVSTLMNRTSTSPVADRVQVVTANPTLSPTTTTDVDPTSGSARMPVYAALAVMASSVVFV